MTIDDLFLEQQLQKMNKLDTAWERFQSEAEELDRTRRHGVFSRLRAGTARALVRTGVWLDRRAGERALKPTTH